MEHTILIRFLIYMGSFIFYRKRKEEVRKLSVYEMSPCAFISLTTNLSPSLTNTDTYLPKQFLASNRSYELFLLEFKLFFENCPICRSLDRQNQRGTYQKRMVGGLQMRHRGRYHSSLLSVAVTNTVTESNLG